MDDGRYMGTNKRQKTEQMDEERQREQAGKSK